MLKTASDQKFFIFTRAAMARKFAVASMLVFCFVRPPSGLAGEGKATAERLNIRAGAGLDFESLGVLSKGMKLNILDRSGEWLKVNLPDSVGVWIPASKFINGKTIPETAARSGPGVFFSEAGRIASPFEPQIISRARPTPAHPDGAWLHIKPPKGFFGWVHAHYVELPEDRTARPAPAKTSSPTQSAPKPTVFFVEGELQKAPEGGKDYSYSLTAVINNKTFPLAHVKNGNLELAKWNTRYVRITGDGRWMEGVPCPIIMPQKIEPAWRK